jgi:16S rRNA (cytosine1402-N4)-methyltransferase
MTSTANPQAAPRHLPVMPEEVIAALAPKDGGIYVDGTFGAGGHTRLLLERAQARVYAIDRDPSAIRDGRALQGIFGDRLVLLEGRFSEMIDLMAAAGVERVDGILLDIGVASMQLDDGARGFSFTHDGPLDMRMAGHGVSAADVVNTLEEPALKHLLRVLGEERRAHAVVRAIAAARGRAPITRTSELAAIVDKALGRRPGERISPATRTFQALRIYVNGELGELVGGLNASEQLLRPGGRLAVLTFHSLEDRIVKRFLKERCGATGRPSRHSPPVEQQPARFVDILPGGVTATAGEIAANPRARSARLRAAERTTAAATALDRADFDEITQLEAGRGC